MISFFAIFSSFFLFGGGLLVVGQCTISICKDSDTEYQNQALEIRDEQEHIWKIRYEELSSRLDRLIGIDGKLERHDHMLEEIRKNISIQLQITNERIEAAETCPTAHEEIKNLKNAHQNLTLLFENNSARDNGLRRIAKRLEKEALNMSSRFDSAEMRFERILEEKDNDMKMFRHNLTSAAEISDDLIKNVRESLNQTDRNMKLMHQNLTSRLDTLQTEANEEFMRQKRDLVVCQTVSNRLQTLNDTFRLEVEHSAEASEIAEQKMQSMHQNLSSAIVEMNERIETLSQKLTHIYRLARIQGECESRSPVCDCSDIRSMGFTANGVYRVYAEHQQERIYAYTYCDLTSSNRSWLVYQRRIDGGEDFFRRWIEYANGFGNPSGEFWLGNEFLHILTSQRRYRLRIEIEDFDGIRRYAEHSEFKVNSPASNYSLVVGDYSGDAGDCLSYHSGNKFTTRDVDNDDNSGKNCAQLSRGGWWYSNCFDSNLNGVYRRGHYSSSVTKNTDGVAWCRHYSFWYSLKVTEMKISADI